jgi:predicted GIY-YIG superfamily endonuclease
MGRREPSGSARSRNQAFFVYVLGCRDKSRHLTYVGWTADPNRRLAQAMMATGLHCA